MSRKIIGVTVGTTLPKPDFNQTDEKMGDFIKNKPDFQGLQTEVSQVHSLIGDTGVSEQISTAVNPVVDRVSTLEDQIAVLLYDPITVTSFTASPSCVEVGSTQTITLDWKVSKIPETVKMENTTAGSTISTTTPSTTSGSQEVSGITSNTKSSINFKVTATESANGVPSGKNPASATKTVAVNFYHGVYWGVVELGTTIDSAAIKSLTNKNLKSGRTGSYTATAGSTQQLAFAIPVDYGKAIITVAGFEGDFKDPVTVKYTNDHNIQIDYYVYLSKVAGLGSTTFVVS